MPTPLVVKEANQLAPEKRPADRIESVNGARRYRLAVLIKFDLIVARLKAIDETAIVIVKLHLNALTPISLQNDLADA